MRERERERMRERKREREKERERVCVRETEGKTSEKKIWEENTFLEGV